MRKRSIIIIMCAQLLLTAFSGNVSAVAPSTDFGTTQIDIGWTAGAPDYQITDFTNINDITWDLSEDGTVIQINADWVVNGIINQPNVQVDFRLWSEICYIVYPEGRNGDAHDDVDPPAIASLPGGAANWNALQWEDIDNDGFFEWTWNNWWWTTIFVNGPWSPAGVPLSFTFDWDEMKNGQPRWNLDIDDGPEIQVFHCIQIYDYLKYEAGWVNSIPTDDGSIYYHECMYWITLVA